MSARDIAQRMRTVRRPKDRAHRHGTEMAAIAPATAIDAAREYAAIAHAARIELHAMIRAAGVIFGTGFQLAAEDLLEQHAEAHGEAVDMYEEARAVSDEWMRDRLAYLGREADARNAELLRYRAYLEAARIQESRRRLRPDKTRPAWFEKSADLFTEDGPF